MPLTASPHHPERSFTLQKYLLLHTQHDALQCHLASLASHAQLGSTTMPVSPTGSPTASPTATSPTTTTEFPSSALSPPTSRPQLQKRRSSLPPSFPPLPTAESRSMNEMLEKRGSTSSASSAASDTSEMAEEERKLMRVNRQIKSTLTELLNCESVRNDGLYRAWVQGRLMDAERELRGGRRHSLGRERGLEEELGRFGRSEWRGQQSVL